jgi:hypothetical protein
MMSVLFVYYTCYINVVTERSPNYLRAQGSTQEISVFERNLPKPFCDDPQVHDFDDI